MGDKPPRPADLAEKEGCYHVLLLVRVEAAMLGGELLCHCCGDGVDVVGHLPIGTYHRPQDLAPLPVGVELGFEAVARRDFFAALLVWRSRVLAMVIYLLIFVYAVG